MSQHNPNVVVLKRKALKLLEECEDRMGTTHESRYTRVQKAQVYALLAVADAINRLDLGGG